MPFTTFSDRRLPIGRRNEQIVLQRPVTGDDGMGGQTILKWQEVATPWAAVVPWSGEGETLDGAQLTAKMAYQIVIPYRDGVVPQMRAVVGGRAFEIKTVVDDQRARRRLLLQVGEIQT